MHLGAMLLGAMLLGAMLDAQREHAFISRRHIYGLLHPFARTKTDSPSATCRLVQFSKSAILLTRRS